LQASLQNDDVEMLESVHRRAVPSGDFGGPRSPIQWAQQTMAFGTHPFSDSY